MTTILSVVGARPNFMKLAPLARALATRAGVRHVIVHTGQHYDEEMSETFLRSLAIPRPDFNLAAGSASHAQQTAVIPTRGATHPRRPPLSMRSPLTLVRRVRPRAIRRCRPRSERDSGLDYRRRHSQVSFAS